LAGFVLFPVEIAQAGLFTANETKHAYRSDLCPANMHDRVCDTADVADGKDM